MELLKNYKFPEFDRRSFQIGLTITGAFYLLLLIYAYMSADSVRENMEKSLASHSILLTQTTTETEDVHPEDKNASIVDKQNKDPQPQDKDKDPPGALIKSPMQGLYEKTSIGKLPIIRLSDNLTSFDTYKRPFDPTSITGPAVAFLIKDYGLSEKESNQALKEFPPEISFLLTPYASEPERWKELARKAGHETWLNIPVENSDIAHSDTGPITILTRANLAENLDNINRALARTTGYVGIASYTDELLEDSSSMIKTLFSNTLKRGIGYLELNPNSPDTLEAVALTASSPYVKADSWINDHNTLKSIEALEAAATHKGFALCIVTLTPHNIDTVKNWIADSKKRGYFLAPASAIVGAYQLEKPEITGAPAHTLLQNDHAKPPE